MSTRGIASGTAVASRSGFASRAGVLAGIAAPIIAWSLNFVVIAGWPGYDPIGQSISNLATAPLGWLETLAFAISGLFGTAWAFGL